MSNNDFDRTVSILQGTLDTAASAAAEEKGQTSPAAEPQARPSTDPSLPGFDFPGETPPADPPSAQSPSDSRPAERKPARLELHPPAKNRPALAAAHAQAGHWKPAIRLSKTTALAALSGVLGLALIIACACLLSAPKVPSGEVLSDIPLALLPETADPSLWRTVSGMSGEIDGAFLNFERGLATDASGRTYRLMLDFCRSGTDIYAKVVGDRQYVVRLNEQGKITKAYPAPKNNKPLKDIFGRR